jgi:A/G-specific adenine glycosylase
VSPAGGLAAWYAIEGRHHLPWRATRDRWAVLVSEVMLHQTQVSRVAQVWDGFLERFPTPQAMSAATPGEVIAAWGTLGYPRRARRLWEAAVEISSRGWPADLAALPGVGRYTAAAVAAQVDDADAPAVETNVRRVLERWAGRRLTPSEAAAASLEAGGPLTGRDRLLALMDVGALLCRARTLGCPHCPLRDGCATAAAADPVRAAAALGRPSRQAAFEGSFRQRRGRVLAGLRAGGPQPVDQLDAEALWSLVADGLATITGPLARLPD